MKYYFRKIYNGELSIAYNLHCNLVERMLQKGIRQWLQPIDIQKLIDRQTKGENFGLFDKENEMKVFLSLTKRSDYHEWKSFLTLSSSIWLNTVSVNTNNIEKGLGKIAIQYALKYLKENSVKELYLDCVINDGFLVNYYEGLGFTKIAETLASYRSGHFLVALMKKEIK